MKKTLGAPCAQDDSVLWEAMLGVERF